MKKQTFITCLFLVILASIPSHAAQKKSEGVDYYAMLTGAIGEVLLKPEGKGKWFKAEAGMGLMRGDTIKTGKGSTAFIVFEGGTIIKIAQFSEIILNTLRASSGGSETEIKLTGRSSMLSKVNSWSRNVTFRAVTPTCVVSVRGTGLSVEVKDDDATEVMLLEGKLVVKDFVEESGLPENREELLLAFLHEISLKPEYYANITKKGIEKPKKIPQDILAEKKKSLEELKRVTNGIKQDWQKATLQDRNRNLKGQREKVIAE